MHEEYIFNRLVKRYEGKKEKYFFYHFNFFIFTQITVILYKSLIFQYFSLFNLHFYSQFKSEITLCMGVIAYTYRRGSVKATTSCIYNRKENGATKCVVIFLESEMCLLLKMSSFFERMCSLLFISHSF